MSSHHLTSKAFGLTMMWIASALAGCCGETEKKAATLQTEVDALEKKLAEINAEQEAMQPVEAELETCRTELEVATEQLGKQGKQEALMMKRQETIKGLLDKLKGIIEAGKLSVRIRRGRMVLALPSEVLFESGKADLRDKGKETLASVAEVLKDIRDRDFQVAGHTDADPVGDGSPFDNNWHLSAARAIAVLVYLRDQGMSPKNLSAAGYAHHQPVASNKTERGKKRNRRIEITLMPNLDELPDLSRLEKNLGLAEPADSAD